MEDRETILDFWFGTELDETKVAKQQAPLWWSKNAETDDEIRRRFQPLVLAAGAGGLDDWLSSSRGRLGLILLTDQFPRNIYRGSPGAFRFDHLSRRFCLEGLAEGVHRMLRPIERVFFYLPLEHAEDLDHQDRCVALFQELASEMPSDQRDTFAEFLDFAERHRVIVERFGRFPHRNSILGRESTPEEIEFLKRPDSSF